MSLAALVSGICVYSLWWWFAVNQFEAGLDNWIDERRNDGIEASFKTLRVSGFPLSIRVRLSDPRAASIRGEGWLWQGEKLTFEARPWAINRVSYDLSGVHNGRITVNGKTEPYRLTASKFEGDVVLANGRIKVVQTFGEDIKIHLVGRDAVFSVAEIQTRLEAEGRQNSLLDLRLRDLRLPKLINAPLGQRVRHLRIKASLEGNIASGDRAVALARWRDAGGKLEIRTFDLGYTPLQLTGAGNLQLDAALQPSGTLSIRASGASAAVNILRDKRLIGSRDAMAAKLAVGMFSKASTNGGERYLELPVEIENRTVHVGPFRIGQFLAIPW